MKAPANHTVKTVLFLLLFFCSCNRCFGQGRVVVNEFMAWSGCNTTSEFIELMNFGPGPMNIGCYIVTNGQYAVTIPPNTILQRGQYYILSGQNTIASGCGNTDSTIHVNLNWSTCNCTDKPVPTTGDGFLMNGGSANEKIVLLDPNLNVLDAVSRSSTPSSSVSITTSTLGGACASRTFDLDLMGISYESINNSTGIDNSYARKVDGDCGWVKTTAISANAPNKTGSTASVTYSFSSISASQCNNTAGSISINVSAADAPSLFPMNYTLAYDQDSNNAFELTDNYNYGTDNSASSIDIGNLAYGRYRITVGSNLGCNLKSFDFFVFNCYGVILPVKNLTLKYVGTNQSQYLFECKPEDDANLKKLILEGAGADGMFTSINTQTAPTPSPDKVYRFSAPVSSYYDFRLRIVDKADRVSYSNVVKVNLQPKTKWWTDASANKVFVELDAASNSSSSFTILNSMGEKITAGDLHVNSGSNIVSLSTAHLRPGIYYLAIEGPSLLQSVSFRFIR